MSLQQAFSLILERYGYARQNVAFAGHHEIRDLFDTAKRLLESHPTVRSRPHLKVVASYGKGNWATIPWISLLDGRETRTTQEGTYVVYLFREDGAGVYIKLAQGVTKAEQQLGAQALPALALRAKDIRLQVEGLQKHGFDLSGRSDLGTNHKMAKLYEASTIAAKYYPASEIPAEPILLDDLDHMLGAYEELVSAGSTQQVPESRKVVLVGTWKTVANDYSRVRSLIEERGAWASPWSFGLKDGAHDLLRPPFYLYVNGGGGQIVARARVDDLVTERGMEGIVSPWPEITQSEWVGVKRFSERQSDVNKTWLKLGSLDILHPFRASELDLVHGLSTPENLLNQNSFGYAYERKDVLVQEPGQGLTREVNVENEADLVHDFDWLQQETLLDEDSLREMIDALSTSPQILLAGPPGTSKTWVARKLAEYIVRGRKDAVRTVQFHPSYTYESFIEGLRPVARSSGVSFELMPGVVLEMVNEMRRRGHIDRLDCPYVLILDEANRANLPRVLGELLFLFEYRSEKIKLQYSGDFSLPKNLYFIGTMNTADRSIRAIDAALRRRFDVFELAADRYVLERYLMKHNLETGGVVSGFTALNDLLVTQIDRHHSIGHAFFMRPELDASIIRKIWDRRIYPLIEEYFFDQPDLAKEFTLARFWPAYAV